MCSGLLGGFGLALRPASHVLGAGLAPVLGLRRRCSPGASCLSLPFKFLRFAAAAQQRGGVVLQISHGVDPIGAGTEPVLHMSGEGVKIALASGSRRNRAYRSRYCNGYHLAI